MAQVSQEYLDGILEGREQFKLLAPEAVQEFAVIEINYCKNVGFWSGSALHADFVKGMRDFWIYQLKKLEA